jgi:hypothetical protein
MFVIIPLFPQGGYLIGGLGCEVFSLAICAFGGSIMNPRKVSGIIVGATLGYFAATAFVQQNILPQAPTTFKSNTSPSPFVPY